MAQKIEYQRNIIILGVRIGNKITQNRLKSTPMSDSSLLRVPALNIT